MKHFQYLIVGGGMAGDAAVRGIRELDKRGSIGMLSAEPDPPYARPHLSKALWKGRPMEDIWRNTQDLNAQIILGSKVVGLDPRARTVRSEDGKEYSYEYLLLATGATPRQLPAGEGIIYFRDLRDYGRLRLLTEQGKDFVVIGGGFIGAELAAALKMVGRNVTLIFPEDGIGAKVFPPALSEYLNEYYREKGVEVLSGHFVDDVTQEGSKLLVHTQAGRNLEVDGVVAGIGVRPNVELARQAGLRIEDGIVVDAHLQTSAPDIYAAGDAANFWHDTLQTRMRVEHEDNALHMGKTAGRNMAGAQDVYEHVPMFYSDLFELGYEAVGELDSELETVADWQEPFKKGVVYYLKDGRVRGVLLWNVWKKLKDARALLAEEGPFSAEELRLGDGNVFSPLRVKGQPVR